MNKVVGFSVGCMSILMLALAGVMYFGMSESWTAGKPEGQTNFQVEQWMEKNLHDKERRIVKLGRECIFEGEQNRYRLAEFQVKGATGGSETERYVLLSKPNGMVIFHWPLAGFIEERKKEAQSEPTPERKAWREKRLEVLLKEMEVPEGKDSGG